ncbi:4856_t:CDS:2, partial [Acaulospora colombiana]
MMRREEQGKKAVIQYKNPERLALPATETINPDSEAATSVELNSAVKLDELGPMVVNSDGTVSRIANWQEMSDIEKERTYKVLLKRN